MATLPKVRARKPEVSTADPDSAISLTAYQRSLFDEIEIDGRNRKERRKAGSAKRGKLRSLDQNKPQKSIYNAFYGY